MGIASNNPANVTAGVCTSLTKPNNPYEGQMVYVTDLDELQVWNGTVWFTLYVDITPLEADIAQAEADIITINNTLTVYATNISSNASAIADINNQLTIFESEIDANASAIANAGTLPGGGTTGQLLVKQTSDNYATSWQDVTDVAIPSTLVDAKGDLIVATANDTVARQAIGDDGFVLTANSSSPTGVSWTAGSSVTTAQVNSKAVAMALIFG
jgi:hypothetical protein